MRVLSFVNKKGGCGKSTLVCALGLYWAERAQKRVAVQDMEVNGGSGSFVDYVGHPNLSLYEEGQEYNYVLIDTQGGITNAELKQVEAFSDSVIVPVLLAPLDIAKAVETTELLHQPEKGRLLINQVRTNTTAWRDREAAMQVIPLPLLDSYITRRTAYANLLIDGWSALNRESLDELERLAWEVS